MVSPFCVSPKKSEARVCPSLSTVFQILKSPNRFGFRQIFPTKKNSAKDARCPGLLISQRKTSGWMASMLGAMLRWGPCHELGMNWGKWLPFEVYAAYARFMFPHPWNMCNLPTITLFCALQPSTAQSPNGSQSIFRPHFRRSIVDCKNDHPSGKQLQRLQRHGSRSCPNSSMHGARTPGPKQLPGMTNKNPLWVDECKEVRTGLYYHLVNHLSG